MDDKTVARLYRLRDVCRSVADAQTSFNSDSYHARYSTLAGHCQSVAYLVYRRFQGEIIGGVRGTRSHWWNRLPTGEEIDLTSDQFPGGDGFHVPADVEALYVLLPGGIKYFSRQSYIRLLVKRVRAAEKVQNNT